MKKNLESTNFYSKSIVLYVLTNITIKQKIRNS